MITDSARSAQGVGFETSVTLRVTLISFAIVMVDGYDSLMISFIAPLLARGWHLHPTDIGRIFAMGYVGAIVGAIGMGPLADRLGRKPMLIAALALAGAATMLCATASSLGMLVALRVLVGIGLGGALPAVMSLTAEHAPPKSRNGTVTLMYIGYPMGAVVGGAVTAAVLHLGWPRIFLGTGVACFLALGLALLLPESFKGAAPDTRRGLKAATGTFAGQFAEGRLWPALVLWLGLFCMLMLTYFLSSWTPSILVANGGSPRTAALGGVVLNLGGIVGALAMTPMINRFGPYGPSAIVVGLGALFVALLGQNLGSAPVSMLVLFLSGACVIGGQLNFPAMTVDLFPPPVRGAGAGWLIGVGRIGSIVGPVLGGVLIAAQLGSDRLFLFAAAPALASALALWAAARLRPSRPRPVASPATEQAS